MYQIKIDNPCTEKWDAMQTYGDNKLCLSCKKTVHDFTRLSTQEAIAKLNRNTDKHACGRFTNTQLAAINAELEPSGFRFASRVIIPGLMATSLLISSCKTSKPIESTSVEHKSETLPPYKILNNNINYQNEDSLRIQGVVIEENQETLAFVNVVLKGSHIGVSADVEGRFTLDIPLDYLNTGGQDSLEVSFIGFERVNIPIKDIANKEIQINMEDAFATMGGFCYVKYPLHKRIWNGFKGLFRRKYR